MSIASERTTGVGNGLWREGLLIPNSLPPDSRALGLNLGPQGLGFLSAPLQVGMNLGLVAEIVSNDGINVTQRQAVVSTNHVFRRHTVLVLLNDQVEANAAFADAHGAPLIDPERGPVGVQEKHIILFGLVH